MTALSIFETYFDLFECRSFSFTLPSAPNHAHPYIPIFCLSLLFFSAFGLDCLLRSWHGASLRACRDCQFNDLLRD